MGTTMAGNSVRIADEVWIATALLHREDPNEEDFGIEEIVDRVRTEGIAIFRPGVYVHIVQHCVANRPPNPGRYRMLVETGKNRRRLFRPNDSYDPAREGSKTVPNPAEIPEKYQFLLDWYREEYVPAGATSEKTDPLLMLRGSGRDLWEGEHADEYIQRLREGWE